MTTDSGDFEALLRQALAPVEPPTDLSDRLEATLVNLTELAQDELEAWELSAMRDPRNWARPVAAAAVGTAAGAALVIVRVRAREKKRQRPAGIGELVERTAHDLASEARKLLNR